MYSALFYVTVLLILLLKYLYLNHFVIFSHKKYLYNIELDGLICQYVLKDKKTCYPRWRPKCLYMQITHYTERMDFFIIYKF